MLNMIKMERTGGNRFLGSIGNSRLAALLIVILVSSSIGSAGAQDQKQPVADDGFDYSSQTLRSGVWIQGKEDGDILQKGEKFTVGFQANQDAYAVVYRIDTDGRVAILWPRSRFDDGFVFGGHEYLLPVSGARRLVATADEGEGFVEAIVSSYPFDLRDLELDFHHEFTDQPWNFQVTGDPFLAMNEVKYVVTGLEDSGDYVITNHLSYYVHQKVDHPRFLCGQCHFEEDVAYHPYADTCTLEISHDYSWSNSWYDNYGYYPVYSNPVYVYVDPWTYRPWVNFWYNPWYTCAPSYGWGWGWGYNCYSWGYSPYYRGGCYDYYGNGYNRYRPLDRNYAAGGNKVKSREHSRVTGLVGEKGPNDRDRNAMRTRTTLADAQRSGPKTSAARSSDGRTRGGTERATRTRPNIQSNTQARSNGGLRIRDNSRVRAPGGQGQTSLRHTAGGGTSRAALTPVRGANTGPERGHTAVRSNNPASTQNRADKPANSRVRSGQGSSGSRTIKTVEPRKKGTRVWNTRPENQSQNRSGRSPSVNTRSRTRQPSVSPRTNSGSKGSKSRAKAPSTSVRKSGGSSKSTTGGSRGGSSGGSRGGSSGGSRGGGSSGGSRGGGSTGGRR